MIKAIVVDDERPSAEGMKSMLAASGKVDVMACFYSTAEANDYLKKNQIDAMFIDIEIPGMNGFEFANTIREGASLNTKCAIIFVTAHEQYAVDAFQLKALDYLLKPVSEKRLAETIKRIDREIESIRNARKLTVKCFGKFTVEVDNREIKFKAKKAEELLALLIDRGGNEVSRNAIIDYLWKESDGDKAIISFNTTLHHARKVLAEYGVQNPIINENGRCKILLDDVTCDYYELMNCDLTDGSINLDTVQGYEKIALFYTAGYLQNDDYSWAEENRLNSKGKYLSLVIALGKYYGMMDQNNKIIEIMKSAFWVSPEDSIIVTFLIEALVQAGLYSLAIRYYKLHSEEIMKILHRVPDTKLSQMLFTREDTDGNIN